MKQKLTSRKLWSGITGVVVGIGLCVTGSITAGTSAIIASILGYMMTEGYVDAKKAQNIKEVLEQVVASLEEDEEEE